MSRLPPPGVRVSGLLSGYLPISAQPFGLVLPIGLKFKLCERGCLIGQSSSRIQWPRWAEFLHQPVSLAIGHPEYHSLWVKHQFLVQSAITKEAGLWLTSCQPMHRALSAAACMARGCGSAWQSQLTFLQNNVLVCCLPSWVWLCQLFNFAANNVRQNVITIIKLLAQFESYFTYVKIKSNLNTSTRRK